MTYQNPSRVLTLVDRRNALLVALSIPLAIAQCADEGARLREDLDPTGEPDATEIEPEPTASTDE